MSLTLESLIKACGKEHEPTMGQFLIYKSLEPLKARARAEGLVFQCNSFLRPVRMTVDYLEQANREGRYLWSPENWTLEKPKRDDTAWGYPKRIIPH